MWTSPVASITGYKYYLAVLDDCRGLSGVPTAGWWNAPAYLPRGSTRGSAKLLGRSSFGARTQEHTDFRVVRAAGA